MASTIQFSGLASGLDTSAIIKAMVAVARQPINTLQDKKATYGSQLSKLSDLSSRLASLRDAARDIDTLRELQSYRATSGDDSKLTAVASSSATAGSYAIQVESLARAERSYSCGLSARDQTGLVGTGDLTLQVGSTTQTIQIDEATDTLDSVVQKINAANAGASASVIYTGSVYRIVVNGNGTGQANAVQLGETGTLAAKLGLSAPGAEVQAATDARVVLDGNIITSSTNQIAGAIQGVTLNLGGETGTGAVDLSVALDPDAVTGKVSALVDAYNSVLGLIHEQFSWNGQAQTGTLMGDAAVRTVKSQLQRIISGQVAAAVGGHDALSTLGISTSRDGTLSLDTSKLQDALATDLQGVTALFTTSDGDADTDNDGVAVSLARSIDRLLQSPDGPLAARQSGISSSVRSIDDRIASLENNVTSYEQTLQRQFTALEQLLGQLQSQSSYLSQLTNNTTT